MDFISTLFYTIKEIFKWMFSNIWTGSLAVIGIAGIIIAIINGKSNNTSKRIKENSKQMKK